MLPLRRKVEKSKFDGKPRTFQQLMAVELLMAAYDVAPREPASPGGRILASRHNSRFVTLSLASFQSN